MKKIRFFPLTLLLCLILSCITPAAFALDDPELPAEAVLLADLDTGEILYEKNMDERRSPASLTKIMTGLLAVEALDAGQCTMDDMVTAGQDCLTGLAEDSSTAGIVPGETMSFRDLFYCAMLHSANETCNVIGTYLAGSIDAFVERMNERAMELGCTDTHFLDTNGLSNEGHYTTAHDLYLITREAIKHPEFMTAVNTVYYDTAATNVSAPRSMYNSNALLTTGGYYGDKYLYDGAAGVKTGYTRAAGYCLVSTAQRNSINAIAIVMGCKGQLNSDANWDGRFYNFDASITLYEWLFDNFSYRTILESATFGEKVHVDLAAGDGMTTLRPQGDVTVLLPNDVTDDDIETNVTVFDEKLVAPIKAGTVLGEVRVSADGRDYGTIKLVNNLDIEMSRIEYIKLCVRNFFAQTWVKVIIVIIILILAAYFVLVAQYRRLRRKHLRERRRSEARRKTERQKMRERQRQVEAQYEASMSSEARQRRRERADAVDDERYHKIDPKERRDTSDFDELMNKFDKYM
ncbi:MAG: D-alanyl-D-alanine carboxypeptidase family protein [Eubacteriales bacterium]|nr:D-alanyl-D-alanine carboxypeptidase family protein [Eubacteriales bacterium]